MATGFLHPGAMGSSIAAACRGERLWCGDGRSEATRIRAEAAGLEDVGSLDALVNRADVIVAVCPPSSAIAVADDVAALGFDGVYVDVNAVSPATSRAIGGRFARFVDGGIVGPPVESPGSTRLYLSGEAAPGVAELWSGTLLETRVVDGGAGAASAVKMCYAGWTKGSAALLLAIRALAVAEGVDETVLAEWATSIPGLAAQSERAAHGNAPKAWRFTGELDEIADSFAAHGLPEGFGRGAADVYRRLARFKDSNGATLDEVVDALIHPDRADWDAADSNGADLPPTPPA
jgi:3-hydroxyisobutyrate dehydrogenase-like beta-hydroxyacid dehydrogenase